MKNLMFALVFLCSGFAHAQSDEEIMAEMMVTCAASLGIASVLTDVDLSRMVFQRDGKWFREGAVSLLGSTLADQRIGDMMKTLQKSYNAESISWDDLLDICEECSEFKQLGESISE